MLTLDQALDSLLATARLHAIQDVEMVATLDSLNRVLARPLVSPLDVPPADNTSMDGFAVRVADVVGKGVPGGVVLPVSQRIAAGHAPQPLVPGTAARIFTGALIPAGADAVVMQEHCVVTAAGVQVQTMPHVGQWIRRRGEDVTRGCHVLAQGERMTPQAMGMAAGVGAPELSVVRRVRVAMLSTGDELVMPGAVAPEAMPVGAIYNSNRFTLNGLLRAAGCDVTDFGIVEDTMEATQAALIQAAASHDLIVSTGGVSVGEEDHVRPALERVGRVSLWQLAIKPGKPLAFGAVRRLDAAAGESLFLGLPGNPVSSFMTFLLAALPVIRTLQNAAVVLPLSTPMRADFEWLKPDPRRREFLRVRRNAVGGLDLFPNQSSGVLTSAVWGDGVVDIEAGQVIARGDVLPFLPWSSWGLA